TKKPPFSFSLPSAASLSSPLKSRSRGSGRRTRSRGSSSRGRRGRGGRGWVFPSSFSAMDARARRSKIWENSLKLNQRG
ncbi:unnamed protein product, partial [Linum tenue]